MTKKWDHLGGGGQNSELPAQLPLIPLLSTVVFPGMIVNLQVSRQRNLRLVRNVQADEIIGLILQTDPSAPEPGPEHLSEIGVAARIINKVNVPGDTVQVILQGLRRFRITSWETAEPYLCAQVADAESEAVTGLTANVMVSNAVSMFEDLAQVDSTISREAVSLVKMNMDGPGHLADQIATRLIMRLEDKKKILDALEPEARLRLVIGIMRRELQVKKVGADIQKQTQDEIGRAQREYILRQQLKTIKKELGETSGGKGKGKDLGDQIESTGLPEEVQHEALAELARLEVMSPASAEYGVIRTYLETLVSLPWREESEDCRDLAAAAEVLEHDHYGLEKVKERILEFLAVRAANPRIKGPILCLAGPPGTGKTSLGRSVARALGRKFVRISVGGLRDEAEIRGHRRTYVGAMPGKIIQALRRCGTRNPVFVIDEIDKIGMDFRGDPASALLEVLDPEQNRHYRDLYLDAPFDLSHVLFLATANRLDTIPAALRDRLEIIQLSGYTEEEKTEIAKNYLIPRQIEAAALQEAQLLVEDDAVRSILRCYTRDAGVRSLERHIAAICRKITKARAMGESPEPHITPERVRELLGPPVYHSEMASRMDEVGVATGLAWTPAGGEILFIEASRARGHGKLKFTGRLGDVMKESVEAAHSYLRSHIDEVGIPETLFETTDLHVHVPSGAIPKDGPSAGVAMVASLASVLTGRRIRHDFAMTGEITLKGRVLPVGGVREKVLAARRAGVHTVILPLWNRLDLENIPPHVREDLRFIFVESVADALDAVLDAESMASVYIDPRSTAAVVAGEPTGGGSRRGKCVPSVLPGH